MKKSGSISVFFLMTFLLLASFLLLLAEGVRARAIRQDSDRLLFDTSHFYESMYHSLLREKYGILAVDSSLGQEISIEPLETAGFDYISASSGNDFLRMTPGDLKIINPGRLTDGNGEALIKLCARSEAESIPVNAAEALMDRFEDVDSGKVSDDSVRESLDSGKKAEDDIEKDNKEQKDSEGNDKKARSKYPEKDFGNAENPIDVGKKTMDDKSLAFYVTDDSNISEKSLKAEEGYTLPSKREFPKAERSPCDVNFLEKTAFSIYANRVLGNYLSPVDGSLSYGTEYLIAGKDSDAENLKSVIHKIILVRTAANSASIVANADLNMEAGSFAVSIAGISANPVLVEIVKAGIIAGWAYVESVLDVRTLLSGGKIAPVKKSSDFTSTLVTLASVLNSGTKARESKIGLDYKAYIDGFLIAGRMKTLSGRTMDLMESQIRSDGSDFYFENLLYEFDFAYSWSGKNIFLYLTEGQTGGLEYKYEKSGSVSFL